jgi:uncharacterized protein YsxB (DUF464 family)
MKNIILIDKSGDYVTFDTNLIKKSLTIRYIFNEFPSLKIYPEEIVCISFSKINIFLILKIIEFLKYEIEDKGIDINRNYSRKKEKNREQCKWLKCYLKIKKSNLLQLLTASSFLGIEDLFYKISKIVAEKLEKDCVKKYLSNISIKARKV